MDYEEYSKLPINERALLFRTAVLGLRACASVELSRDRDFHVENATDGEAQEPWRMELGVVGRTSFISSTDDNLERLLINGAEAASKAEDAAIVDRDKKREAALAKLSAEDRRILGLK